MVEKEKVLRHDIEVHNEEVGDMKTRRKMTSADIKIVDTPGNHDSIFEEPYVEKLTGAIINNPVKNME